MRVALVAPPRLIWPYMNEQDNYLLPQSLACLAAVLRQERGIEVHVIDCMPEQLGWRGLARRLQRLRPHVVGAGENHALFASECIRLVRLAKRMDPDVVTVLGGAHFTNVGEAYLASEPIDFIVRGEGELTLLELVRALQGGGLSAGREVPGLACSVAGQVVYTPPRPLVEHLDELPLPAYDLMPMQAYGRARYLFSPGGATLHHSRGCAARCAFCVWWTQMADRQGTGENERLRPRWRTKSVERTLQEVELLYTRHDKRCLVFVDPTFNLDAEWNDAFATALLRKGWDLRFFAFMRADCILRDERLGIFEKLVRSGLRHVCIGIERAEDEPLETWNKRFQHHDQTTETFRLLRERYPRVFRQATFIVGLRSETRQSLRAQLRYARELGLDYPAFHPLTPFPGTELWREAQREGWLEIQDFDSFDMMTPLMGTDSLTREELEHELIRLNQDYVRLPWLLRGLLSRGRYRRDMYTWWLLVTARVFASTLAARLNPFRAEHYTALVKPRWYDR